MKPSHRLCPIVFLCTSLIVVVIVASSCSTDIGDNIVVTGTVTYISLEGGFYGIKGDDGKAYDPINLSAEFQKDGLRIRFEAKELKDRASFHMWGMIIEIVHIQKL